MRDPERIHRIMSILESQWTARPDLRFGQLIFNTLDGIWDTTEPRFFHLEDDLLEEILLRGGN